MSVNATSSQPPQSLPLRTATSNPSRAANRPSCNVCRRRKIKCDRADPCSNCRRASVPCVTSTPSRVPRGRQGGRKKVDSELLQRIAKLETLVNGLESETTAQSNVLKKESPKSSGGVPDDQPPPPRLTYQRRSPKSSHDGSEQSVATPSWLTINDEISGLRFLLSNQSSDDEEDDDDLQDHHQLESQGPISSDPSGFVICGPEWFAHGDDDDSGLSRQMIHLLCSAYLSNVHPMCKILHGPSVQKYLHEETVDLECSPGRGGLEALRFSILHAATNSLTEEQCGQLIGDKMILLAQLRSATEKALAKADFVNTVDLSTLQALMLFLYAIRSYDSSRRSWTLISIGIRIAHALGLNRDDVHTHLPLFEKEMRRRLWWQMCCLDSSLAQDRGSDPVITKGSFNTRFPLHINDADIWLGGPSEVSERAEFCDMTFVSMCFEGYETMRQLNFVPAGESETAVEPDDYWERRRDMVLVVHRRIQDKFLKYCDISKPFNWYTKMIADVILALMWLNTYRPLQQRSNPVSQIQHPNILLLSVEVIEKSYMVCTDPSGARYQWLSASYTQWHPLAITLAELCVQTEGPLVERAWTCVGAMFERTAMTIADSDRGMQWRAIKKLMAKAQRARQERRKDSTGATGLDSTAAVCANVYDSQANMGLTQAQASTGPGSYMRQAVPGPATQSMTVSPGWLPMPVQQLQGNFDWDPWLVANQQFPLPADFALNQSWSNWENFVGDLQDADMMQGQEFAVSPSFGAL